LSAQEIEVAAKLIRGAPQFPGTGMFSTIVLKEPLKADVLAYTPGAKFARQAFSIVLDRRANKTYEVVADLGAGRVLSWTEVKGVQPPLLDGEYDELSKIVKADPSWQAAMRKRNITDFSTVQVDGWAVDQVAAEHQSFAPDARGHLPRGRAGEFLRPSG
jgi:primary-amine oxidase